MNNISPVSIDKSAGYQNKIQAAFAEKVSQVKDNSVANPNTLGRGLFLRICSISRYRIPL